MGPAQEAEGPFPLAQAPKAPHNNIRVSVPERAACLPGPCLSIQKYPSFPIPNKIPPNYL
jgi:hypothetical protein